MNADREQIYLVFTSLKSSLIGFQMFFAELRKNKCHSMGSISCPEASNSIETWWSLCKEKVKRSADNHLMLVDNRMNEEQETELQTM